jgi:hypothetical protein
VATPSDALVKLADPAKQLGLCGRDPSSAKADPVGQLVDGQV